MQSKELALELTKLIVEKQNNNMLADSVLAFTLKAFTESYKTVTSLGKEND